MRRYTIASILIALATTACQSPDGPDLGNPLDPTSAGYTPPSATITSGPEEGATADTADITFAWRGVDQVNEYRYRLDDSDWTAWASDNSATFELLDEGDHQFALLARYPTGDEQTQPTARGFSVDAVKGPALMFRPRKVAAAPGETFLVDVVAEEVAQLMLVHAIVQYDDSVLTLESVTQGEFLAEAGGRVVFLDEAGPGSVLLDSAVAEGDPEGVSGSGTLATLTFHADIAATTTVQFAGDADMRDRANAPTIILEAVDGVVVIE
jgi:hypothetical protein